MEHVVQFDHAKNLTWARNVVDRGRNILSRKGRYIGAAWLSSARVVRCWVKSRNERNPYCQLPAGQAGHSGETAPDNGEEGGDDAKSSWPYVQGYTRATMGGTNRRKPARGS